MSEETSPLISTNDNGSLYDGTAAGDIDEPPKPEPSPMAYLSYLIPMAVGLFLSAMDQTIVVSTYASIGSELHQLQNTSWIATAYMLTATSFQPLYGKLSDIFGRKNCLIGTYLIFATGSLFCGLSRNMTELIISRAFAGIGGGGMTTITSIIMTDVVPLRIRGTWQGFINVVYTSGSITGAPLGGFLADTIGWRWAFLLQVPLAIIAIVSVAASLHLPKLEASNFMSKLKRVDFAGSVCLILAISSLLLGLDRGGNKSWTDKMTVSSLVVCAVGLVLFYLVEAHVATEPIAPGRIVFNKSFVPAYLVNSFSVAVVMSTIFYISLYLQAVRGKSPSNTGFWLVFTVLAGLSGSLSGGFIMQITGKFYAITVMTYVVMVGGTVVLLLTTGTITHSLVGVALGLIITFFSHGIGTTTTLIALIANASKDDQAVVTAASYLFRSLGGVLGVATGSTLEQTTLRSYLKKHLAGNNVDEIISRARESLSYLDTLDPETRAVVQNAYAVAVQVTMSFVVVSAACALVLSIFIKGRTLSRD